MLEFDHVGAKHNGISLMLAEGASIRALRAEIAKCEVVCVNCHRRRTARRGRSWRKEPGAPLTRTNLTAGEARNIRYVREVLIRSRCVDCDEDDLLVLEFDHVRGKTGSVMAVAQRGWSLDRLKQEIARCEVRCANCHRRRTWSQIEAARSAA